MVMAGANRFEALVTPDSMDIMTAMENGAKLVVLDPRFTKTAALAQEWHPIKPGTDMAFFLALANVLISEEIYDKPVRGPAHPRLQAPGRARQEAHP
jgi:thiosulfate reductase/polysulfide reductase chain A